MTSNRLDWNYDPREDGAIDIPVRATTSENTADPTAAPRYDADEQVVRDYEERYYGMPRANASYTAGSNVGATQMDQSGIFQNTLDRMRDIPDRLPPRHRYAHRSAPTITDDTDRLWAAGAHASALITLLILFSSGGLAILFGLMIPLGIYLYFRKRSEYVAFHALQAFTFQTVCTVGGLAVIMTLILGTIASAVASIILIGLPFLFAFLTLLILSILTFIFTIFFVLPVYSLSAAFATFNGRNFRYPWVADWVDDQVKNPKVGATLV